MFMYVLTNAAGEFLDWDGARVNAESLARTWTMHSAAYQAAQELGADWRVKVWAY